MASGWFNFVFGLQAASLGRTGYTGFACGAFVNPGDAQSGFIIVRKVTSNATPVLLAPDAGSAPFPMQVNSAGKVRGDITARNTSTNDTASWTVEGAVKMGATAASTAIVGTPVVTKTASDAGASAWTLALVADTTYGGPAIQVTGAAATIRWVGKLELIEVA